MKSKISIREQLEKLKVPTIHLKKVDNGRYYYACNKAVNPKPDKMVSNFGNQPKEKRCSNCQRIYEKERMENKIK